MVRAIGALKKMNAEPTNGDAYREWVQQSDVVSFLENETTEDDIVVLASFPPHVFIHGILIPRFTPDAKSIDSLLDWNFNATASWGIVGSLEDISIGGPLDHTGSPLIQAGEMIVFQRGFEGVREKSHYFELNQKISQVLGLHFMEARQAWCDLNRHGDIDEVVKIHTIEQSPGKHEGTVITIRSQRLAEFSEAGGYTFLRMFDFARYRSESFAGWGDPTREPLPKSDSVFGTLSQCGSTGSYSRGVQIVDLAATQAGLLGQMLLANEEKKYETFIAVDLRHRRVGDFSCDPDQLANYFTPSEHPFEISPAFFRPEVLSKYKADTEKYLIEHRSISCRGSWYLKAFGVNEAGQVHAYLGYLGSLPYEEQLHWKQFNEAPKAGLSDSVIATDFRGEWSEEYDPLLSFKRKLHELDRQCVGWWVLRGEGLPDRVHYPFTDSRDEWGSELMNLDQFLVEGLAEKWLRKKAKELGRNPDGRLRALHLLEECLVGLEFDPDHARELIFPWREVHNLRSMLKGHASGTKPSELEREARTAHGNLVGHFRHICEECDSSLETIISAFREPPRATST